MRIIIALSVARLIRVVILVTIIALIAVMSPDASVMHKSVITAAPRRDVFFASSTSEYRYFVITGTAIPEMVATSVAAIIHATSPVFSWANINLSRSLKSILLRGSD